MGQAVEVLPPLKADGRSRNGGARPGAGRPGGQGNYIPSQIRQMVLDALIAVGGTDYFVMQLMLNPSAMLPLVKHMVPTAVAVTDPDGQPAPINVIERRIVSKRTK